MRRSFREERQSSTLTGPGDGRWVPRSRCERLRTPVLIAHRERDSREVALKCAESLETGPATRCRSRDDSAPPLSPDQIRMGRCHPVRTGPAGSMSVFVPVPHLGAGGPGFLDSRCAPNAIRSRRVERTSAESGARPAARVRVAWSWRRRSRAGRAGSLRSWDGAWGVGPASRHSGARRFTGITRGQRREQVLLGTSGGVRLDTRTIFGTMTRTGESATCELRRLGACRLTLPSCRTGRTMSPDLPLSDGDLTGMLTR